MESDKSAFGNLLLGLVVVVGCYLGFMLLTGKLYDPALTPSPAKPRAAEAIALLKSGNERFAAGEPSRRHTDAARLALAGRDSQAKHAWATVLACSDSQAPVELLFDAGVMDLVVVRVAGNVAGPDAVASVEYGLAQAKTPLLVVLGHTRCGAVAAALEAHESLGRRPERPVAAPAEPILPAVKRAAQAHPGRRGAELLPAAAAENVWQAVEDLMAKSPTVRGLVKSGALQVAPALYDAGSGKVEWLAADRLPEILARAEAAPVKESAPAAAK